MSSSYPMQYSCFDFRPKILRIEIGLGPMDFVVGQGYMLKTTFPNKDKVKKIWGQLADRKRKEKKNRETNFKL
jgi:hypothetical protein